MTVDLYVLVCRLHVVWRIADGYGEGGIRDLQPGQTCLERKKDRVSVFDHLSGGHDIGELEDVREGGARGVEAGRRNYEGPPS
jgi:hypothetical protein